jgi:hypothetical protein
MSCNYYVITKLVFSPGAKMVHEAFMWDFILPRKVLVILIATFHPIYRNISVINVVCWNNYTHIVHFSSWSLPIQAAITITITFISMSLSTSSINFYSLGPAFFAALLWWSMSQYNAGLTLLDICTWFECPWGDPLGSTVQPTAATCLFFHLRSSSWLFIRTFCNSKYTWCCPVEH